MNMSNWREEYYAALGVRDEREKANLAIYDAYTRLADRTSRLHSKGGSSGAAGSGGGGGDGNTQPSPTAPPTLTNSPASSTVKGAASPSAQLQTHLDLLAETRQDLAEAQKSRAELADQLAKTTEQLERMKKRAAVENQKLADLAVERTQLQVRIKDRDEELRGKAKLLDDVQAEVVSLNLQFNMAEEKSKKLQKDNQELIDRWMAKKSQEAEAMNRASKFS